MMLSSKLGSELCEGNQWICMWQTRKNINEGVCIRTRTARSTWTGCSSNTLVEFFVYVKPPLRRRLGAKRPSRYTTLLDKLPIAQLSTHDIWQNSHPTS